MGVHEERSVGEGTSTDETQVVSGILRPFVCLGLSPVEDESHR